MENIQKNKQKKQLQKVLYGDKPKIRVSPYQPIMEITQENHLWIAHCINKKTNKPMGLKLDVSITMASIKITLIQNGNEIARGESKHDINEAINIVKQEFAINNMLKFLNTKK